MRSRRGIRASRSWRAGTWPARRRSASTCPSRSWRSWRVRGGGPSGSRPPEVGRRPARGPRSCGAEGPVRVRYSPPDQPSPAPHAAAAPPAEDPVTSNISQAYPYSSETEAERAAAVAVTVAGHAGLDVTIAGESSPLDPGERRWTYRHGGCGGTLHVAGYARDQHAVYVAVSYTHLTLPTIYSV